jgi:glycosyltransferase involved in cell wall biosynthesis
MGEPIGPDVSIVIPTKDRVDLLRRALASVERQGGAPEVIVVDDGDGSGAEAAMLARPGRVTTLTSAHAGQVAARNMGVGAARGRWIAFLDDDDWWDAPDHLAIMLSAATPAPCVVFASGRIVAEGARSDVGTSWPFVASADAAGIRRDNRLLVSGVLYPRAAHATLGPFDPDLPYYWDWDWYLRLFEAGFSFRPAASDAVRISARENSVSAAANEAARAANLARLADKHGLEDLRLRNHESIARTGNRPS